MFESFDYITKNVRNINERILKAADRYNRDPGEITLLAAIKYANIDEIKFLHEVVGVKTLGENRVQQLLERYDSLDKSDLDMHFIGTLQTNKVKYIVDKVNLIHSVDSLKLAAEIDKQCKKIDKVMNVLCEINCGREAEKSGVLPEAAEEFCLELAKYPNIKLAGFMTMAPNCGSFDEYRKYFSETTHLVLDIWRKKLDNIYSPIISMGMSGSFEAAIAEGSTIVRVGRSLFERN